MEVVMGAAADEVELFVNDSKGDADWPLLVALVDEF